MLVHAAFVEDFLKRRDRREASETHAKRSQNCAAIPNLRAERPKKNGAEQRQKPKRVQHKGMHPHHPRNPAISSTSTYFARRNVITTIASPIAASAAAVVITRNVKTCPALFP